METKSLVYTPVLTFDYELVTDGKTQDEIQELIKHLAKVASFPILTCYFFYKRIKNRAKTAQGTDPRF